MEKPLKQYVVEVRGEEGLERTLYLTGTSAREVRQRAVARGYKVVRVRLDQRPREETEEAARGRKERMYSYIAKDALGKVITGTSEAESEQELVRRLREKGYFVQKVEGPRKRTEAEERAAAEGARDAIRRVVAVILEQAIRDRASTIRIEPGKEGGTEGHGPRSMFVQYQVGGAWHDIMSVPLYVWQPVRERFAEMSGVPLRDEGEQIGSLQFEMEGKSYTARVKLSPGQVWVEMPVDASAPTKGTGAEEMTEALSRLTAE